MDDGVSIVVACLHGRSWPIEVVVCWVESLKIWHGRTPLNVCSPLLAFLKH